MIPTNSLRATQFDPATRSKISLGQTPSIRAEALSHYFGSGELRKQVLFENHLTVYPGEIIIMTGPSGSGKTTLLTLLGALRSVQQGNLEVLGQPLDGASPKAMEQFRRQVGFIFQAHNLFDSLNATQNVRMAIELCYPHRSAHEQTLAAEEILRAVGLENRLHHRPKQLSGGQKQRVAIARGLVHQPRLVLADEPTAALSDHEVAALFRAIARLKARGVAIVYTTHKMDEVFRLADRISVLRDGRLISTAPANELDPSKLISLMVGREMADVFPMRSLPTDEILLDVSGLTREPAYRDVSFQVRRGEVVALAGLMGAGRTEVVSAVYGLQPATRGVITFKGRPLVVRSPQDALSAGIGMVTEDRKGLGLIPALGVNQNITLTALRTLCRGQLIDHRAEAVTVGARLEELAVKASRPSQPIAQLSGGNQQKALLARCLLGDPDLIILDEPTRGIDIGAKAEIYALIQKLAQAGKGVLLVSSELPEVLSLAHRIVVLRRGSVATTLDATETDQETVLRHAMPL